MMPPNGDFLIIDEQAIVTINVEAPRWMVLETVELWSTIQDCRCGNSMNPDTYNFPFEGDHGAIYAVVQGVLHH